MSDDPAIDKINDWAGSIAAGFFSERPDYRAFWSVHFAKEILRLHGEIDRAATILHDSHGSKGAGVHARIATARRILRALVPAPAKKGPT